MEGRTGHAVWSPKLPIGKGLIMEEENKASSCLAATAYLFYGERISHLTDHGEGILQKLRCSVG
jgi:hypothetical protein